MVKNSTETSHREHNTKNLFLSGLTLKNHQCSQNLANQRAVSRATDTAFIKDVIPIVIQECYGQNFTNVSLKHFLKNCYVPVLEHTYMLF